MQDVPYKCTKYNISHTILSKFFKSLKHMYSFSLKHSKIRELSYI